MKVTYYSSSVFKSDSEYDVEFKTAAEENAGTDANVYFQMFGEDGESQEIDLKNKGKGYFNRGQLDRFRVRARDVGRVRKFCLFEDLPQVARFSFLSMELLE